MTSVVLQVLLLPVHVTLSWLFLVVRTGAPKPAWRRFDWSAIGLAFVAWGVTAAYAVDLDPAAADIWGDVYATAGSYMIFNAVLWTAWIIRRQRHRAGVSAAG